MNDAQQAATVLAALIAACIGVLTLLGLAVRWVLLPYIRDQLVRPIRQINAQVTPEDGSSDATIVNRLEEVVREVRDIREENRGEVRETRAEVIALSHMFDGHLEWSQAQVDLLAEQIRHARETAERAERQSNESGDKDSRGKPAIEPVRDYRTKRDEQGDS